ncbi:MAG TPA: hypothetical protein VIQ00_10450 [Chitinophagaceae bacterium]
MNKSNFISLGIFAILVVFAVGCTTARGYEDMRYENRGYGYNAPGYYEPYGYYESYPVIIDQRSGRYYRNRYDDRRYYQDRRYNNNRRNNNQQYNNQKSLEQRRLEQQQYEQQKRQETKKIEESKQSVLGNKKN